MTGKNLIIRGEYGRVVEFLPNEGENIDHYKELEDKGFKVERTNINYVNKWGRWYESY